MKSNATLYGVLAALIMLAAVSQYINQTSNVVTDSMYNFGSWLIPMLPPPVNIFFRPAECAGLVAGLVLFPVVFLIVWRLEIWGAGQASDFSAVALNAKAGLSVQQTMKKLIKKYGRRK